MVSLSHIIKIYRNYQNGDQSNKINAIHCESSGMSPPYQLISYDSYF